MTSFQDRETAFEAKFAHDEEMIFKVDARTNKLLGMWAGDKLGKSGADLEAYAKDVISSDFKEAGHEDVITKVAADLNTVSADEIRAKRGEFLAQVKAAMMDDA